MKSVNVNPSTYFDFNKENNKEDPKFEVGDNVRISKYKCFFGNGYLLNWSEQVFVIKKLKILFRGHIVVLVEQKSLEHFKKRNCQKEIKKYFRVEKVIKKKVDKLYVKWKGFDSSFNSWIDKKGII